MTKLASRRLANRILDRAKAGEAVSNALLMQALRVTGDLVRGERRNLIREGSGPSRCNSRALQPGRPPTWETP